MKNVWMMALLSGCFGLLDGGEREGDEPGECSDGADNDFDGFFDCEDEDCVRAPDCDDPPATPTTVDADADTDVDADTDTDVDADTDTDVDADTDTDTDTDTDVDTDTDADTDPNALQCSMSYPTPAPNAGGTTCVTEYVSCGDEVFASLAGGTQLYDFAYWQSLSEVGALTNDNTAVNGLERIYVVEDVFPGTYVTATLESCDDVWGSYIVLGDQTLECHNGPTNAPRGHFTPVLFGRQLQEKALENSASGVWDVQFIVDTHPGTTGNFKISFDCGIAPAP